MNLLLDTHLLLWAAYQPGRLSSTARRMMEEPRNTLVFSAASVWEVAIKASRRPAPFGSTPTVFRRGLVDAGYVELPVNAVHASAVADLADLHRDPFDRILIAQAHVEGFVLLTADHQMAQYGEPVYSV